MQTSSFFHPLKTPGSPFSGTLRHPNMALHGDRKQPATMAFKKDGSGGKMVDENMIVLRERIGQLKAEMEYDGGSGDRLPDNWMQWERTYYYSGCYHSDVYEVVVFLQRFLVENGPSVAVGLVALFVIGGSTAAVTVMHLLIKSVVGN
ncbi:hypothetical protein L1987_79267 [Smallanthus sonchifolius]|uniref:Uncharacterized protein n=1 Tax=Smallanthus sonchifolius TaxID=185202 RepID=A0ACB8ZFJ2_9ASTR|nr:hypothetical protein L1987_79267 [Smallanthus sonchifolius]